jgi:glycogen operon protein
MSDEDWNAGYTQCLGARLPGDLIGDVNERGEPVTGDSIVLLVNAHHKAIPFTLPSRHKEQEWERLIDTADPEAAAIKRKGGEQYEIKGRSMVILRSKSPSPAELSGLTALGKKDTPAGPPKASSVLLPVHLIVKK